MTGTVLPAFAALLRDERGTSLAEYAFLAATVGMAMIAGTYALESAAGAVIDANAAGWQNAALSAP